MAAPVTVNGVQIYPLSTGKAIPQWLTPAKRKQLTKSDPNFAKRIELLQDFTFPEASNTVSVTGDGRYIIATGTYHPRVRVWDTTELSMKFERYMDSASTACCALGDDYSKLAFLQEDRHIEIHARYGRHYRTRIPIAGRHMVWHAPTAELLVPSSSPEVYRLSLEEGKFLSPIVLGGGPGNAAAVSRVTALIAIACDGGRVEMWDPRGPDRAALLRLPPPSPSTQAGHATCVAFEEAGLGLVVGTADARALVFDLRRAVPLSTKVHPYGLPVKSVAFHRGGGVGTNAGAAAGATAGAGGLAGQKLVMSTDSKQIKLWGRDDGTTFSNIEGSAPLNAVCIVSDSPWVGGADSGLLLAASEQERVQAYYVPALGVAPRWAAFLDSLTEELAEGRAEGELGGTGMAGSGAGATSVYDDFRFVTREELAGLGLEHLVGTPLLRAYMHGFFMDSRLYSRVRSVLDGPRKDKSTYEGVRAEKVAAALAAARGSRTAPQDALPSVNADLAKKLRGASGQAAKASDKDGAPSLTPVSLLADSRFARLFTDSAFAIDPAEAEVVAARRGTQTAAPGPGKRKVDEEADGRKGRKRKARDADSDEDDA